jgi:hypothetical protein
VEAKIARRVGISFGMLWIVMLAVTVLSGWSAVYF